MTNEGFRLADLLAALSVVTDLGMGQRPEKAIRSCLLATGLARGMGLPDPQIRDTYWAGLLRHLGCTATADDEAYLFGGDELVSRPASERADFGNRRELMALTLGAGRGAGASLLPPRISRARSASRAERKPRVGRPTHLVSGTAVGNCGIVLI